MVSNMLLKYLSLFVILTVCKFAMVQSQELLFSPQQPISYTGSVIVQSSGTSTSPQFAPINIGTSTNPQPAPIFSDIPFNYQSLPVDSGTFTASSPINSFSLLFPPINSGTSVDSQSPPISTDWKSSTTINPDIELFAHTVYQLLLSTNAFGNYRSFVIYEPYSPVFDVSYSILKKKGVIDPTSADLAAQAVEDIGLLRWDLYYSTVAHLLAKFLDVTGTLSKEVMVNGPQKVMSLVQNYADENGISDPESVMMAVANGFYNYADSLGLITVETLTITFPIFAKYIKELADGSLV